MRCEAFTPKYFGVNASRFRLHSRHFAPFAHSPLTPLPALLTLPNGIQRERIAPVSGPAFLLDASECRALEMPDLRTPADFYSVV
jgi:hypothetical protein